MFVFIFIVAIVSIAIALLHAYFGTVLSFVILIVWISIIPCICSYIIINILHETNDKANRILEGLIRKDRL